MSDLRRIGVINASSRREINALLAECTKRAVRHLDCEVVNYGVFGDEAEEISYVETAVHAALLLNSGAVDFIVTGCSSGQGMMLACNSLPGVVCGYAPAPADAYLFGRINAGNAVSLPLGLNFGWAGEINLQCTLDKLFEEPFGIGYPAGDAERKRRDTRLLKEINDVAKIPLETVLQALDRELVSKILQRKNVIDDILEHGTNNDFVKWLRKECSER